MMQTMDCGEARISLGVYVLGAIDPAERSMVDAHLATCQECRDELAGLAGLPALLARVDAAEAIALAATDGPPGTEEAGERGESDRDSPEPPRELLATVLDLTAARRRRRRWRDAGLSVAAVLIIAAGVFGGIRLGAGPASPGAAIADPHSNVGPASGPWRSVTAATRGMAATVAYRPTGWGTQVAVKVNGIPMGTACQLWVVGKDGSRTLAGGWVTDQNEGAVWYPASAGLSATAMHGFQVTVGGAHPQTIVINA